MHEVSENVPAAAFFLAESVVTRRNCVFLFYRKCFFDFSFIYLDFCVAVGISLLQTKNNIVVPAATADVCGSNLVF